ncbi:MAG: hypothetical protein Q4Q07_10785 [Tissierellia bacterium]|nr:hypothetical protein [Tissierellia bacterium]
MRESKGRFKFYNANPRNLVRSADCVFRALALALDVSWEEALEQLTEVAIKVKDAPNSDRVIEEFLKKRGYQKEKQMRKADNTKYTTDEFCKKMNEGVYVIRVAKHVSVIKDGFIYDTWDCRYKTVGNYWKIK